MRRSRALADVAAAESRLLAFATAVDACVTTGEAAEAAAVARLGAAKEAGNKAAAELAEKRNLLAQVSVSISGKRRMARCFLA